MDEPILLSLKDVLFIHRQEIEIVGGEPNIREEGGISACVEAPKASFDGEYLQSIFEMAASYIACFTMRHPFIDGNKRTALASALTFLNINGFEIEESTDKELAQLVLDFVTHKVSKKEVAQHLESYAIQKS